MKKTQWKRQVSRLLPVLAVLSVLVSGCAGTVQPEEKSYPPLPDEGLSRQITMDTREETSYYTAAESDTLRLWYRESSASIRVEDKRNGTVWESSFDAEKEGINTNSTWRQDLASSFLLTFTSRDGKENIQQSSVMRLKPLVWTQKEDNGLRLTFYFSKEGFGFDVVLALEGDRLRVTVPYDSFREEGLSKLISLQVFPFLSLSAGDDGYYLLPDGSGALMRLNNPHRAPSMARWVTYSPLNAELDVFDKLDKSTETLEADGGDRVAAFPLFGVSLEKGAFAAYATEGEEEFLINTATAGIGVDFHRIFGEFSFHTVYEIDLGTIKKDSAGNPIRSVYQRADNVVSPTDRTMIFEFLPKEEADYSGMAARYRQHLEQSGLLDGKTEKGGALVLDLFIGAREETVSGRFITATTFEQAQTIIGEITAAGVDNLIVNLKGWQKNGYGANPMTFTAGSQAGGEKALRNLAAYCHERGVTLNLGVNLTDVTASYGGLGASGYGIRNANNDTISDFLKTRFLMNLEDAAAQWNKLISRKQALPVSGILFERIGELVIRDYNGRRPAFRSDAVKQYRDYLEQAREHFGFAGVQGTNLYGAAADLVMDTQNGGAMCVLSDVDVPVYQMLLHGSTMYTGIPFNLYADTAVQRLKNIEYGANPYFELTWEEPGQLTDTAYKTLFSGQYDAWKDTVVQTAKEYAAMEGVFSSRMLRHTVRGDGITVVEYDGWTVVLNYAADPADYNGRAVPPMDYIVIEEG